MSHIYLQIFLPTEAPIVDYCCAVGTTDDGKGLETNIFPIQSTRILSVSGTKKKTDVPFFQLKRERENWRGKADEDGLMTQLDTWTLLFGDEMRRI